MPEKKVPLTDEAKERLRGYRSTKVVGIRFKPGDLETLEWLADQLGMSKSGVMTNALAAYAKQVQLMRK